MRADLSVSCRHNRNRQQGNYNRTLEHAELWRSGKSRTNERVVKLLFEPEIDSEVDRKLLPAIARPLIRPYDHIDPLKELYDLV